MRISLIIMKTLEMSEVWTRRNPLLGLVRLKPCYVTKYLFRVLGLVGAPACGDVMKLQFEVDEKGVIVDAKFKTFGCGSAIGKYEMIYMV